MKDKEFREIRAALDLEGDLYKDSAGEAYRVLVENWSDAWKEGYDPPGQIDQWTSMMTKDLDEVIELLSEVRHKLSRWRL